MSVQRQRARMLHDRHAGDPEHPGQLIRGHLERPGAGAFARRRLRIGRRACGVEGDVAFDLLHDLMNVSVQHGNRTEAAQLVHELIRIAGTPAPGLVDGPQRHVGEDHDRCAG